MAESVPVRCPVCRREHSFAPPVYPCACGAPVTLPLLREAAPVRVLHRTWEGSWVEARCGSCGTAAEWPQPELGCDCGTLLRIPVARARGRGELGPLRAAPPGPAPGAPAAPGTRSAAPRERPAFRPVTIRTGQDAKTAAAQYLRWLGFTEIRVADKRPASGVDLRGPGIVAHVDPTTSPTALREIETLWLNGLNESALAVCFSLAGYSREGRVRADELSVALFVLDLTGTPQPVNDPADDLIRTTA
ncbi:hypothetical protein [Streptomyces sp. HNM0574]|uniref:hypothetical protein n=1 Tax=Streptomyces sp. HNM0574 TaxID=2714954 RepID=UPI00146DFE98|nr:hypothetical protein [Streptomyces sp. HNM0574]NLU65933.1 hypothetical protein [Streptomyces sp. HNM0574]